MEVAHAEQKVIKDSKISNSLTRTSPELQDWMEVFVNSPAAFLRISFSVDMSMAVGRYPTTQDLPRRLSPHVQLIPSTSIPQSIMPAVGDPVGDTTNVDEAAALEPARNSYLDYFDFGPSHTDTRRETSPWNGKHIDRILEEVIGGGERFWATDVS